MMLREHRGWAKDRHLFSGHGDTKGCTDRNLGLSETNIATHQSIHGFRSLKIVEYVRDGARLIGRLIERKGCFER